MPIKRHYPDQPLAGVGAVIFRGEEVLLVRRGRTAEPARDFLESARRSGWSWGRP